MRERPAGRPALAGLVHHASASVSIVVPFLLTVLATAPLHQVYLTTAMWVTIVVGALLGTAIATAGAARRWPTLTVLAFALPTFFLFGALAAPRRRSAACSRPSPHGG